MTPRCHILAIVTLALCAAPSVCRGQAREAFQLDDFISPNEMTVNGERVSFLDMRAIVGLDHDYTYANDIFDQNVGIARFVSNYYVRQWQFNVNYTRFAVSPPSVRPIYAEAQSTGLTPAGTNTELLPLSRTGVQVSFYDNDSKSGSTRTRLFWNTELLFSGQREHEFGLQEDARLPLVPDKSAEQLTGGFYYVWRPARRDHSFGLAYDALVWRGRAGAGVSIGGALGANVFEGSWQGGTYRIGGSYMRPIARSVIAHYVFSLTNVSSTPLKPTQLQRTSYESAVFISLPVFSKLF